MDQLVLFRQRIDSLNNTEYQRFLRKIGRESVTTILFKGFHKELLDKSTANLQTANNVIDTIVLTRATDNKEDDDDEDIDLKVTKFTDIHSALLANISSFYSKEDMFAVEYIKRVHWYSFGAKDG